MWVTVELLTLENELPDTREFNRAVLRQFSA